MIKIEDLVDGARFHSEQELDTVEIHEVSPDSCFISLVDDPEYPHSNIDTKANAVEALLRWGYEPVREPKSES